MMLKVNVLPELRSLLAQKESSAAEWTSLHEAVQEISQDAFNGEMNESFTVFHQVLFELYALNFIDPRDPKAENQFHPEAIRLRNTMETVWLKYLNSVVDPLIQDIPANGEDFTAWMLEVFEKHDVNDHPLYNYLQEKGNMSDFSYFFQSEVVVNSMFEEFIAFTQMGAPTAVKIELAKNYWDEMGNGKAKKVHTAMFDKLLGSLGITELNFDTVAQINPIALSQANLFLLSAVHKKYFYQMMGVIGAGEYLVPKRYRKIVDGARRNGMTDDALEFYIEHISVDTDHAKDWLDDAVAPTIIENPDVKIEVVRGAYMRMMHIKWFSDVLYKAFTA